MLDQKPQVEHMPLHTPPVQRQFYLPLRLCLAARRLALRRKLNDSRQGGWRKEALLTCGQGRWPKSAVGHLGNSMPVLAQAVVNGGSRERAVS